MPGAWPPILAPPAGSPHAHLPFRISLSSVSFGLQLSLVESQVQEEPRRHRRHQCHQCVGVAVHAEIRLLVRLTSFFGDRDSFSIVFPVWCVIWFGVLVFTIGVDCITLARLVSQAPMYDISILKPASTVSIRIYTISSIFVLHRPVCSSE